MGGSGASKGTKLEQRVIAAAEAALAEQKYVAPLDVLTGLGWLPGTFVDRWRQGRIDHLLQSLTVAPDRIEAALATLRRWAEASDLRSEEISYVAATRDRRDLRFTASGDPATEAAYRTHWISPAMSTTKRERLAKAPDLLVILPTKAWTCAECDGTGDYVIMDADRALCLSCADMDHLVFLGAGDAALTRRAKKLSGLSAVVVEWQKSRKRYQRRGILVEESALDQAEEQCLADADLRERRRVRDRERRAAQDVELQTRMAAKILDLYPGCPPDRAEAIAEHTALRGSGRVGRSAAGRALDDDALRRAVIASIRHQDTNYDTLLMSGVPRDEARTQIRRTIDQIITTWSTS